MPCFIFRNNDCDDTAVCHGAAAFSAFEQARCRSDAEHPPAWPRLFTKVQLQLIAMREAEMADLKKQVEEINDTACSIARSDPLTEDSSKAASSSSTAAVVCEATPEACFAGCRRTARGGRGAARALAARALADAGRAVRPGRGRERESTGMTHEDIEGPRRR